jgi:phytoene dehydrogenase-like protein
MSKKDFDAVVVGSGPNGLAAAIVLQQAGLTVLLLEAKDTIGGGLRSAELTLPGFTHDICSAIHPMAAASPFFSSLPLHQFGLEFISPTFAAAHPFDDGTAAVLEHSIESTAGLLGEDAEAYQKLIGPIVKDWDLIVDDMLAPFHFPGHPFAMAAFGLKAIPSALTIAKRFNTKHARGLWAGMAAHAIQPLSNLTTSAIGLVLMSAAHLKGWPIPKGGSSRIANALANYFISIGGKIETNVEVKSLEQLPSSKALLFDVTPKQLLQIAGHKFSTFYEWQLKKYRYGMGVFKIDWALDAPIPFRSENCRSAGTIHLGNTLEEIAGNEKATAEGAHLNNLLYC